MEDLSTRKVIKILQKGSENSCTVELLQGNIVRKIFNSRNPIHFFKEVISLKKLQGSRHIPKIYKIEHNKIYMEYCGQSLNNNSKLKIPSDWKKQVKSIINHLIKNKINHNDILPKNICIINNTIKLIDFELANSIYSEKMLSKLESIIKKRC